MTINGADYYRAEFAQHLAVAEATGNTLAEAFDGLLAACVASIRGNGKILFFGNGGSAADAQHLAAELAVRYRTNRRAIAAIALTTDTSIITAAGNDLGFDQIFARQIEALGRPGDVAIAISTSGTSANVIAGICQARAMGLVTAALGSLNGGKMGALVDHLIAVPSGVTARIQEMHITVGHILCGGIERQLGLAD